MTKRFIYIPFSSKEDNANLFQKALIWQRNLSLSSKKEKVPQVVIHGESKLEEPGLRPTIYIISHEIGESIKGSLFVGNEEDPFKKNLKRLNMAEIAKRIKADGLTPALQAKIKLFICSEVGNHELRAVAFLNVLGEGFRNSGTSVDYYKACVTPPITPYGPQKTTFKHAFTYYDSVLENRPIYTSLGKAQWFRGRIFLCETEEKLTEVLSESSALKLRS